MDRRIYILVLLIFIAACSSQGTKVYKVEYKGNYPAGAFMAAIGNSTVFTNADILEVHVKRTPDFFCYAVNKQALCKFNLEVRISEPSENLFLGKFLDSKKFAISRNKTAIPGRLNYYLNGEKLEEDVLTVNDFANKTIGLISVPVTGKGATEEDAEKASLERFKEVIKVLRDKK